MNDLVVNVNDLVIQGGDSPMALPAHLQGVDVGVSKALLAGMFSGGNRIGLKGSRFRLVVNGQEEGIIEENYLDTIMLNAAPAVSRVFYSGAYRQGENVPPTCFSADGIAPPPEVQYPNRQSDKCMTCPQNVKGSKISDGQKYKACGYFRRLVLFLAGDVVDRRVFKLDAKAGSLWGDDTATAKNLQNYIKSLESRGVDVGHVVTRMSFNLDSSVPTLVFRAFRYITPDELDALRALVVSDEVKQLAEVSFTTLDLSGEEPTGGDAPAETAPAATQAPRQQTATPAAQTPARPAQQQTVQQTRPQAVQQATRPQQAAPAVETVPAAAVQPQQTVQQTARPQTARPQTAPVQQVQQPAAAVTEVGDVDELSNILDGLD